MYSGTCVEEIARKLLYGISNIMTVTIYLKLKCLSWRPNVVFF